MISAKIVADSKNEFGNRITTMVVTFPRIILAEFNTHRMFSRNSASSRAIPFEKMVKSVKENPFIPIAWQRDHKGMQGIEYVTLPEEIRDRNEKWLGAMDSSVSWAKYLSVGDTTKQLCNRLLEPFMWHTVIVTATEWENFFALRCPQYDISENFEAATNYKFRSKKDVIKAIAGNDPSHEIYSWDQMNWLLTNKGQAEIHMMALAEAMYDAYQESTPKQLKAGEWHIPFGDDFEKDLERKALLAEVFNPSNPDDLGIMNEEWKILKIKIATARCAQVSYTVVGEDGKESSYENLIKLHDRLAKAGHWSPFEHCARAMNLKEYENNWSGNFSGFVQYRKMFANENIN